MENPTEDFIAASTALIDILERETEALNKHAMDDARLLVDEKTKGAFDFEKAAMAFHAWVRSGEVIGTNDRERLQQTTATLRITAADNERRVRAAQEAHRQVIELVRGATASAAPSTGAYGRGGEVAASRAARSAAPSLRFHSAA
jgi:hypothetical protein